MSRVLSAVWDLPQGLHAFTTTRCSARTKEGYDDFNLAAHVGDDLHTVEQHRRQLLQACEGLQAVQWLDQVHGTHIQQVDRLLAKPPTADAAVTADRGLGCAVLTADCLPVLFCDSKGAQVAAAHAGWRGLLAGVLVNTVNAFVASPSALRAWLGPCIRQPRFEVGAEVRDKFLADFVGPAAGEIETAFVASARPGRYLCDLAALAAMQLRALKVQNISDSGLCSYDDPRFYSYRRENPCGRFASLIYRMT
ncbi:MAG: YfiH family protein [Bermanella sp.]|jgi:YfiH family protein